MVHSPLTIGDIVKVLDCLKFDLIRKSARNNFYVYSHPNRAKEIYIPSDFDVISVQWLKNIVRQIEDCGISHEEMINCGFVD